MQTILGANGMFNRTFNQQHWLSPLYN